MSTYPTLEDFDFPVALAVSDSREVLAFTGAIEEVFDWKSVTKPLAAWATLVAIDQGHLALDDPAGPDGSTVRHLLAHASGLPFEEGPTQSPERRRVYSNMGFDVLAEHVGSAVGSNFDDWMRASVLEPLEMDRVELSGSAAFGASGTITDLLALALELLVPTLVTAELAEQARTVQFPGLDGVLPGFGRQQHNDWGLGMEIRDHKSPHWTAEDASPDTFGHFGQSGSFVWVDPGADLTAVFLGERSFRQDTHAKLWPRLNAEILASHRG
ncbi:MULTISPECIES: serine hydrolase domain-containing protein [unclassified Pseudactinotalea]|uniref:serine hydrolase domain-containing protein n=1 Tax=Micrococcales TaxID=85006 RepID=UPI003C7B9C1E